MPADDLILNVRQIASYPPSAADPTDALLAQRGGLGGPYVSLDVAETIANALALGGGPLQVGVPAPGDAGPNGIFVNYVCSNLGLGVAFNAYHAFPDQWNYYASAPAAAINLTAAGAIEFAVNPAGPGGSPIDWNVVGYLGPLGNMQITGELTLGADPSGPMGAATAQWVEQVFAGLQASTVWSFNGRRGDIRLSLSDVIGAGGAPLFSPRFEGSPRAWTPEWCDNSTRLATTAWVQRHTVFSLNHLLNDHPFVFSFNGRTGDVTLQPGDIQNAEAALLNSPPLTGTPTTPTPPPSDSSTIIANTQYVTNALTVAQTQTASAFAALSDIYAPINSPVFTGFPSGPTAAAGTATGQLATCAFVMDAVAASVAGVATFNGRSGNVTLESGDITGVGGALLASPNFTGVPTAPTAAPGTTTDQIATTAWVMNELGGANVGVMSFNGRAGAVTLNTSDITTAGGAPAASPALTGVPTAPTAATGTNSGQLATTAFVVSELANLGIGVASFNGRTGAVTLNSSDVSAAGGATLASPIFTGQPTAPTAAAGTSSQQLATTAFVTAAIAAAGGVSTFNGRAGAVTLTTTDVNAAGGPYLPTAGGSVTGPLTAPTPAATDNSTNVATTAWVQAFSAPRQNRNRLLNGAFNVDQWNNFGGVILSSAQFACDRWRAAGQSPASGRYTSQSTVFNFAVQSQSYRCLNLIQYGTVTTGAATDAQAVVQAIEWQNVGDLRWGTPAAKPVTLSFWAQIQNFPGAGPYTLSGSIRNNGSTRSYPFTYTLPVGGWTYVAITIPGDQAPAFIGAAVNSTDGFIYLTFDVGSGANVRGPPNAWGSGSWYGATGAVGPANVGASQAILQLANIQLEAGTTATPFDWKSTAQESIECQRYYYVSTPTIIWCGNANAGTNYYLYVAFNQTMRITPAVVTVGSTNVSGFPSGTPPTVGQSDQNGFRAYANASGTGAGLYFSFGFTANAEI